MDLDPAQLAALVAIADHGTFEAAARQLHVTPSARSASGSGRWSRPSARCSCAGRRPCRPTAAGRACCSGWRARPSCCYDEAADALAADGRRSRPSCRSPSTPTRWRPGSAACWARSPRWDGRGAAAARRGPGVLRRPAAQRRRAGRGDLRARSPSRAARSSGSARCATVPAAAPDVRRAVAARARRRLGADADGGVQREGRPPARRAARAAGSTGRPSCTGCRPRPTSTRRSGSGSAGRPSPSPSSSRTSASGGWCC